MNRPLICYRCGQKSRISYMGLPYCGVCFHVVEAMLPAVRHDPPPGFPGASSGAPNWANRMLDIVGPEFEKEMGDKQ